MLFRRRPLPPDYFEKREAAPAARRCEKAGCAADGLYRAPKGRDRLRDYWWFCLDHVREYNAAWNYYEGLGVDEIEAAIREAMVGERPTWKIGENVRGYKTAEEFLRARVRRRFMGEEEESAPTAPAAAGEIAALRRLGLTPPVVFEAIKARYRILVKEHHPDRHQGDARAEETLKEINQAFTLLKTLYAAADDER